MIVTASVAANTDPVPTHCVSTQTVMPRSNVAFKQLTTPKHKIRYLDDDDETEEPEDNLKIIESRLKKKKLPRQKSTNIDVVIEDESDIIAIETFETVPMNESSELEDSIQEEIIIPQRRKAPVKTPDATFNSWSDSLDFPEEKVELPRNYFSEGPTPWSNFQDLVLGTRFLNARLSPIPPRICRPDMKQVTWSDSQKKIVNDLMNEANSLMEMFDQVAMLLGPDIKLHNVTGEWKFVYI